MLCVVMTCLHFLFQVFVTKWVKTRNFVPVLLSVNSLPGGLIPPTSLSDCSLQSWAISRWLPLALGRHSGTLVGSVVFNCLVYL